MTFHAVLKYCDIIRGLSPLAIRDEEKAISYVKSTTYSGKAAIITT